MSTQTYTNRGVASDPLYKISPSLTGVIAATGVYLFTKKGLLSLLTGTLAYYLTNKDPVLTDSTPPVNIPGPPPIEAPKGPSNGCSLGCSGWDDFTNGEGTGNDGSVLLYL